jgi:hypothetical protein
MYTIWCWVNSDVQTWYYLGKIKIKRIHKTEDTFVNHLFKKIDANFSEAIDSLTSMVVTALSFNLQAIYFHSLKNTNKYLNVRNSLNITILLPPYREYIPCNGMKFPRVRNKIGKYLN